MARHSLFGVDKNPMAIELAKVALWIETVEPGKPLSFLDAHLRCGDSLLGVYDLAALKDGIPDEAYKPLTGDVKAAAAAWKRVNKIERDRDVMTGQFTFAELPNTLAERARHVEDIAEDNLASVEAKADAFGELLSGQSWWRLKTACDLYVAAFLMPKTTIPKAEAGAAGVTVPTTTAVREKLAGRQTVSTLEAEAVRVATEARAFHWPLEFPQVFFFGNGRRPGFDLALGNPPWDVKQLSEEEYFSSRAPDIAQLKGKARKDSIELLRTTDPKLWTEYQNDRREFEAANEYFRSAGRFPRTAVGKINTYALFAELFAGLGERAGVIVPTGIATDATTAPFFAHLVDSRRLAVLTDFENRDAIFTGVHRSYKFALLALASEVTVARFSFFLTATDQIIDPERRFALSPSVIKAINPNTRTAPVFRSRADAGLTKAIYDRVPVLIDNAKGKAGNPWGIEFRQGLFNMTSDSGLFRMGRQLAEAGFLRDVWDWVGADSGERYVPLFEAKMIHQHDHRWATYDEHGKTSRDLSESEKTDPALDPIPRYWVPETDVEGRLNAKSWRRDWLMGWRDICRATDERTVIAGAIPRSGCGDTLLLMFPSVPEIRTAAALLTCLDSIPGDYVARQKIGGTHLKYNVFKQLAVLPPSAFSGADLAFIVPRVLELTYTSHAMKPFAEDLGHPGPPFAWDEDRRALLRAKLYGITRDQLRYILDPADVYGPDYPSETFRVLKKKEIAKHGEYRTARLVLDAWDRMERGEL